MKLKNIFFLGIAPMAPIGHRRNSNPKPGFSPYDSHNIQTLNTNGKYINYNKNFNVFRNRGSACSNNRGQFLCTSL